jgi:predicted RNA-binding protein with TRAM domain
MMNMMIGMIVVVASFLSFSMSSRADDSQTAKVSNDVVKVERVGGNFTVAKIQKLPSGGFSVDFKASEGSPKFARLHLESDHINAGLEEGETLRLSADVIGTNGDQAEIGQVVVFMPGRVGPTPVWMLSKKSPRLDPPAKLLKMHAPSTDYAIF